ncbi:hypothetical protein [Cereibacter sphaeroides]|jgi:hypothetical protein|uniref:hypothetical protein n=1 Tax=Cereibacter sphaeroides TaxID=1063 RepID=UPI00135B3B3C
MKKIVSMGGACVGGKRFRAILPLQRGLTTAAGCLPDEEDERFRAPLGSRVGFVKFIAKQSLLNMP